jgi:hypothetical protein
MAKRSKQRGQARTSIVEASTTIGVARNPVRNQLASVVRFRVGDVSNSGGSCSAYTNLAAEVCKSARDMPFPDLTAQHILVFHAIELALKGYLVHAGLCERELKKKFSHDLEKLFAEAKLRGLAVNVAHVDELISWSNEYHKDRLIRYDIASFRELPMCKVLFPIVDAIVSAIPTALHASALIRGAAVFAPTLAVSMPYRR